MARRIEAFGWSMGGAIVLQHVSRSWTADRVKALVLDSPVIDWKDVLEHHARLDGRGLVVSSFTINADGTQTVDTVLTLSETPMADPQRYDRLRAEVSHA